MNTALLSTFALVAVLVGGGVQPEPPSAPAQPPPSLRIRGMGLKDLDLKPSDLATLPRKTVTVKEREGNEAKYEGVAIQEILTKAGMSFGQSLRGPRLRDYLLASDAAGYGVVFALPEISEEFSDRVVIVADKIDGGPITGRDGPLKIIVSDEKKHARWVRNVVALTVRSAAADEPPDKK